MIGFIDSGIGGLSILQACQQKLPQRSFAYLADTVNHPYGELTSDALTDITQKNVSFLADNGCTVIILACNSVSAVALRKIQQTWVSSQKRPLSVLGIIAPTVEHLTQQRWSAQTQSNRAATIGILATPATVASGTYEIELKKRAPHMTIFSQECPSLAHSIEGGRVDEAKQKINQACSALKSSRKDFNSIILGCTHYELARHVFKAVWPEIPLLNQPELVADRLDAYLHAHPKASLTNDGQPVHTYWATSPLSLANHPFAKKWENRQFLTISL